MVLLDAGLNALATNLGGDITKGQWGENSDTPSPTDTGLTSPIASTLITTTNTASNNTMQAAHTVNSTLANGETFTEFELQFSNGDSLMRSVGGSVSKTSTNEVTTVTGVNFVRQ